MTQAVPPDSRRSQSPAQDLPEQAHHSMQVSPTGSESSSNPLNQGLTVAELLRILRRRYKLLCFVTVAVTALALGKALLEKPLYAGKFQLLLDNIAQEAKPKAPSALDETKGEITESDYLTIEAMLKAPKQLKVLDQEEFKFDSEKLKVERLKDTKIVEVSYQDSDPRRTLAVLTALSKAYLNFYRSREETNLHEAITYLEQQFPGIEENVNRLEADLEKFRRKYNIVDPSRQSEELVAQRNNQEQLLRATEADLAQLQARYKAPQQQLKLSPNTAVAPISLSESSRYQKILNDLLDLDQKIAIEEARVYPNNPTLLALQDKKAKLEPLLGEQARRMERQQKGGGRSGQLTPFSMDLAKQMVASANEADGLRRKQAALRAQKKTLQAQFERYPSLARQNQALQRKLDVAQKNLNSFLEARSKLRLQAAEKRTQWELIDGPRVDPKPVSKLPRTLLLGVLLGCVSGVGACLMRDQADHVYHSSKEVTEDLKQPILAVLPYVPDASAQSNVEMHGNQEQFVPYLQQQQKRLEAFRNLYTNLRFLGTEQSIRTLVIGSAAPGEGKSTVASLLAQTAVCMGQRVLLIDADLRNPWLHKHFNLNNVIGLSSILNGTTILEQTIQRLETGLSILTSGQVPPDPVRLLSSNCMTQLIADLQSSDEFDLVIFDGPILLGLADTSSFAHQLDGLLLVVSLGKVDRNATKEVIQKLKFTNTSLLGIVTNTLSKKHSSGEKIYEAYHSKYSFSPDSRETEESIVKLPKEGVITRLRRRAQSFWDSL